MKKFREWVKSIKVNPIRPDLALHIVYFGIMNTMFWVLFFGWPGFIAATAVCAAKEIIWDKWLGFGKPEWIDFLVAVVVIFIMFGIFMRGYDMGYYAP